MKTTILRAFMLPIAAFALASAGAVSTNTSDVSKTDVLIIDAINRVNVIINTSKLFYI